jgi:hypothetical protein
MSLIPNPSPADRFWVVWSPRRGDPTKRHDTLDSAVAESERLAARYKGDVFHVLENVGFAQKVIPSTFTYVA